MLRRNSNATKKEQSETMTLFYIKGTTDTHKSTSVTCIIAMIYLSKESLANADSCGVRKSDDSAK